MNFTFSSVRISAVKINHETYPWYPRLIQGQYKHKKRRVMAIMYPQRVLPHPLCPRLVLMRVKHICTSWKWVCY
jgi:hypothetical protein